MMWTIHGTAADTSLRSDELDALDEAYRRAIDALRDRGGYGEFVAVCVEYIDRPEVRTEAFTIRPLGTRVDVARTFAGPAVGMIVRPHSPAIYVELADDAAGVTLP